MPTKPIRSNTNITCFSFPHLYTSHCTFTPWRNECSLLYTTIIRQWWWWWWWWAPLKLELHTCVRFFLLCCLTTCKNMRSNSSPRKGKEEGKILSGRDGMDKKTREEGLLLYEEKRAIHITSLHLKTAFRNYKCSICHFPNEFIFMFYNVYVIIPGDKVWLWQNKIIGKTVILWNGWEAQMAQKCEA